MGVAAKTQREAEIVAWCASYIGRVLDIEAADVQPDAEIERFGLDSAIVTSMLIELEEWLEVEIPPSLLFEHGTLRSMAAAVTELLD